MSTKDMTVMPANTLDAATMASVLLDGNLARLKDVERVAYMTKVCDMLGLNPLTKPFEFITLNGKLVMYARRECTEQLRKLNGVSIRVTSRELVDDVYVVTAQASDRAGRCDESTGAVSIKGLAGEAKANALMKAETKAKRRVTLSISGLGMLDESEVQEQPPTPHANFITENAKWSSPSPKALPQPVLPAPAGDSAPAGSTDSAAFTVEIPSPTTPVKDAAPSAGQSTDHDPKPGEFREMVERFDWKWFAGRAPTKPERAAVAKDLSKLGEWVSLGVPGMEPQRSDAQNVLINVLRQKRGIEDADWRDRLYRRYGKRSSADLCVREASDWIDLLEKSVAKNGTAADKAERQQRRAEGMRQDLQQDMQRYLGEREPGEDS